MSPEEIFISNALSTLCLCGASFALGRCIGIIVVMLSRRKK